MKIHDSDDVPFLLERSAREVIELFDGSRITRTARLSDHHD
ncbi:hypothetical protein BX264_0046 [Streptomyces sp. 2333.5]|nr:MULTISPECIES: hypothetical protein [unclassified Streptomyces]PJI99789.1 hypothetical protein BX264_0046 [Streptomyces sp. 2333.5]SEB59435.1 hypothetical protein SAMN05428943_0046 [Streptomyces sp. 2314.4]SEC40912.1 hypothetical protein SAMN05428942_0046 [Streptomyces sp. 2112.2]